MPLLSSWRFYDLGLDTRSLAAADNHNRVASVAGEGDRRHQSVDRTVAASAECRRTAAPVVAAADDRIGVPVDHTQVAAVRNPAEDSLAADNLVVGNPAVAVRNHTEVVVADTAVLAAVVVEVQHHPI